MSQTTNIFTVEDLLIIKEYVRVAVLMPVYLDDVISCLGYEDSSIEPLSPESFRDLFESINNNGRAWDANEYCVEPRFKERLSAMTNFYDSYEEDLNNALQLLDEMIQNNEVGDMTPIITTVRHFANDLEYNIAHNDVASQSLELFKSQTVQTSSDLQTIIDLAANITDSDIKKFLFDLNDELQLVITFSTNAEASTIALWAGWSSLSEPLESILNSAENVSQQSDVLELYLTLSGIVADIQTSYEETQSSLDCFTTADTRYENEYPGMIAPLGSYIADSKNITVLLQAECQQEGGGWQQSQINITNFNTLIGLIANENGQLTLQEEDDWSNPYAGYCYYPAGSYRKSSRNIEVLLTAECKTDSASYQSSTFSLTNEFIITLKNDNGVLSKET